MQLLAITFPAIDPVAISIGPLAIRWYALAYISGIVLGWIYARGLIRSEKLWAGRADATRHVDDLVFYATLGILFGGRLGYVLFYMPQSYLNNPGDIGSCGMAACRFMAAPSASPR